MTGHAVIVFGGDDNEGVCLGELTRECLHRRCRLRQVPAGQINVCNIDEGKLEIVQSLRLLGKPVSDLVAIASFPRAADQRCELEPFSHFALLSQVRK